MNGIKKAPALPGLLILLTLSESEKLQKAEIKINLYHFLKGLKCFLLIKFYRNMTFEPSFLLVRH